jgi:superfamily I DNA/RNA helicase
VVFGAPGTGKTSFILNEIRKLVASGVPTEHIAFTTFSKHAVREALRRLDLPRSATPWFRTLHSCAFRLSEMRRDTIMTDRELQRFNQLTGYEINAKRLGFRFQDTERHHWSNEAMFLAQSARSMNLSVAEYYSDVAHQTQLQLRDIEAFAEEYQRYKRQYGLKDFSDLIDECDTPFPPEVSHIFVDEAQDLTPQQWEMVQRLTVNAEEMLIVGDDDQTIYGFAGASAKLLVEYAAANPSKVDRLRVSHRLPKDILTLSQTIAKRLKQRVPKNIQPRSDNSGGIKLFTSITDLDFSQGEWLVLARHQYQLRQAAEFLHGQGFAYWFRGEWSHYCPEMRVIRAWEHYRATGEQPNHGDKRIMTRYHARRWPVPDRMREVPWSQAYPTIPLVYGEYYRRLQFNQELAQPTGRIRLLTIHESKGTEADNVALLTSYSGAVKRHAEADADEFGHQDELRILYVALTRVRENLYLQTPDTNDNYFFTLMRGVRL